MQSFQKVTVGILIVAVVLILAICSIVVIDVIQKASRPKAKSSISFVNQVDASIESIPRSYQWRVFREDYLLDHPNCAACGTSKGLQLHHIKPFHTHPKLECDPNNVIQLCGFEGSGCHFYIGHDPDGPHGPKKPNFKLSNPNVVADAAMKFGD